MDAGRAAATPALIVEDASLPTERRIVTTLAGLAMAAEAVAGPALLIVGEAMALAQAAGPTATSRAASGTAGREGRVKA
jgi:uroporphyrin-III C-methyltransferase